MQLPRVVLLTKMQFTVSKIKYAQQNQQVRNFL